MLNYCLSSADADGSSSLGRTKNNHAAAHEGAGPKVAASFNPPANRNKHGPNADTDPLSSEYGPLLWIR